MSQTVSQWSNARSIKECNVFRIRKRFVNTKREGKIKSSLWLFATRSIVNGDTVIYHVEDRTTEILWPKVLRHVDSDDRPTTTERLSKKEGQYYQLHTDGWAAYLKFDFNEIKRLHKRNIHGNPGDEKRDLKNSNLSEGLWGQLKTELRRTYITLNGRSNWLDFVFEAL